MSRRVDRESLAAGLAVIGAGTLLLLDQSGSIELSAALIGAINAAMIGIILLVGGLSAGPNREPTTEREEEIER